MNDFVEENGNDKSCWSVTGWALVAALAVGICGTVLAGTGGTQVAVVTDAG